MQRHHGDVWLAILGSSKLGFGDDGLKCPARTIFLFSWNANILDLSVRIEGAFGEKDHAPVVSHMELPRDEFVLEVLHRLLQGDYVPPSCNAFLDCGGRSTSRCRAPA